MEWRLRQLFIYEITQQCTLVAAAAEDLATAEKVSGHIPSDELGNEPYAVRKRAAAQLWLSVQSILVGAANISKLLWGSKKKRARERAELRAALEVHDDSPLNSAELRNHLEHFDERLERWFAEDPEQTLGRARHRWLAAERRASPPLRLLRSRHRNGELLGRHGFDS